MTDTSLVQQVRLHVFGEAAATGRVPQRGQIAAALRAPETAVQEALRELASGKAIILAPHDGDIWAANPFCAVPSPFRVAARGTRYAAICIWDALGIPAALGADATIHAACGDCGAPMTLEVVGDRLASAEGVVHFAVPALRWWDNIGFT
ncbi:MAG: hypothetical protein FJW14_19755 [Acidimicrobiia bacterium]|nr:hypothetical protein [Acidimicrobiia bacterium]